MHDDTNKLRIILKQAQMFAESCKESNKTVTWSDYEYFKKQLQSEMLFGYEFQLADILGL